MRSLTLVVLAVASAGLGACASVPPPLHPKAVAHQAQGADRLASGDLDAAAGQFALALDYEPRMAEAENGLGLVALKHGDKARAESHFRAALALDEDLVEAHQNLGWILLGRDDREGGLAEFRAALAVDPGYGAARFGTGQALLSLGREEAARWELAKLCAAEPDNAFAHAVHARVLARLGRIALAETEAQKALQLAPDLPAAHRARAEILIKQGDAAAAVDEMRAALAREPASIDDRLLLAEALTAADRFDEASADLAALEQAAPRRPEVHFARAYLEMRRSRPDRAAAAARQALDLRATYPEARLVLAEALYAGGQDAAGRAELARFLDEAPATMNREREAARRFLDR